MALISQKFKNDTKTNSIDVEPVIVLADSTDDSYTVLDIYSNSTLNLKDQDSNTLKQSRPIINKISSIKNSIDYESKNIKVNTFRFSIHNYHDITKKLTSSDSYSLLSNNSLMGKNVILFYKTQTCENLFLLKDTTLFDTGSYENDPLCSIMFYGVINRVTQTDETITIQAEDLSQEYIKDKELPVNNVGGLPDNIKSNISDRDDTQPIPMVFGSVEHAPTISYKTNLKNSDGFTSLGFIHDSYPINSFDNYLIKGQDRTPYHLFLEDDDDYVAFPYQTGKNLSLGRSYFVDIGAYAENESYIVPEIQENAQEKQSIYCIGFLPISNVVGDGTGDNKLDGLLGQIQDIQPLSNTEAITREYLSKNMWKKEDDLLETTPLIIDPKTFTISTEAGTARWILLQLNADKVFNRIDGTIGLYTELGSDGVPNPFGITNTENVNLYIKPFSPEYFKLLFENVTNANSWLDKILDDMPIDGDVPNYSHGVRTLLANQSLDIGTTTAIGDQVGDSYFDFNHQDLKDYYENSDSVNRILLFDFYKTTDFSTDITFGHFCSDLKMQYIKEITDYENEKFYASIIGRKDYVSTEKIEHLEELEAELQVTPFEAALGADNELPDFEALINEWDEYFIDKYTRHSPFEQLTDVSFLTINLSMGGNFFTPLPEYSYMDDIGIQPNNTIPFDYNYKTTSDVDDSTFMTSHQIIHYVLHGCMKKLNKNILDYIIFETEVFDYIMENLPDYFIGGFMQNDNIQSPFYNGLIHHTFVFFNDNDEFISLLESKMSEYNTHRRALLRRIFKYLYQNPLNEENNVDSVFSGFTYEYNSFEDIIGGGFATEQVWLDNLQTYLDDTMKTINTSIYDIGSDLSPTADNANVGHRAELYVWDDNPSFIGTRYPFMMNLFYYINYDSIQSECFTNLDLPYETSGVVEKPVDIFINILIRELGYGSTGIFLDKYAFNSNLIEDAREYYEGWRMGFCIDESVKATSLLKNFCNETKSIFNFTNEGKFGLITIKNSYNYDDLDYTIDKNDVISYKISRTKRENIITGNKYYYNYDNGKDRYKNDTGTVDVKDLYPQYNGYEYYNVLSENTFKEKELRYHSDRVTAKDFQVYDLGFNINQHLLISLDLPLNYTNIDVGSIIHIPLLNDNKAFGLDYSKIQTLNDQTIYPIWIVTGINITTNKINITAMQLHHIKTNVNDVNTYTQPDENVVISVNTQQYHTFYKYPNGDPVENWNYVSPQSYQNLNYIVEDSGLQIPYGDITGNGEINVVDVLNGVNSILGITELSTTQNIRGDIDRNGSLNVADVVNMIDIILSSGAQNE